MKLKIDQEEADIQEFTRQAQVSGLLVYQGNKVVFEELKTFIALGMLPVSRAMQELRKSHEAPVSIYS